MWEALEWTGSNQAHPCGHGNGNNPNSAELIASAWHFHSFCDETFSSRQIESLGVMLNSLNVPPCNQLQLRDKMDAAVPVTSDQSEDFISCQAEWRASTSPGCDPCNEVLMLCRVYCTHVSGIISPNEDDTVGVGIVFFRDRHFLPDALSAFHSPQRIECKNNKY